MWKGVVGRSRPILQIVSPWRDWIVVATIAAIGNIAVAIVTIVAFKTVVAIVTAFAIRKMATVVVVLGIEILTVVVICPGTEQDVGTRKTLIAIVVEPHSHRLCQMGAVMTRDVDNVGVGD